jgi:VanZ family protein
VNPLVKYQLPPVLWALLIYGLSILSFFIPQVKIPAGIDKIAQAFMYFVLCWLARRAFYHQDFVSAWKSSSFLGAFIFSVVYGLLNEYRHYLLSGRDTDFYNVVAATGGALLYVATGWFLHQSRGQEKENSEG